MPGRISHSIGRADVTGALNGKAVLCFTEKRATRLELPDLSKGRMTTTVFAVFSNPVAGDKQNANPRIFTASDGRRYDYQVGISLNVPDMETGGPRQMMATFADRWAQRRGWAVSRPMTRPISPATLPRSSSTGGR